MRGGMSNNKTPNDKNATEKIVKGDSWNWCICRETKPNQLKWNFKEGFIHTQQEHNGQDLDTGDGRENARNKEERLWEEGSGSW